MSESRVTTGDVDGSTPPPDGQGLPASDGPETGARSLRLAWWTMAAIVVADQLTIRPGPLHCSREAAPKALRC